MMVEKQQAKAILVAPVWPSQVWCPKSAQSSEGHSAQTTPRGLNAGRLGGVPTKDQSPFSRMAYLRQYYSNQNLSKQALDLLLSSWRQKTSQSYDSLCKRWISWCSERNSDPVSGPIEEVVNFLAQVYEEGYQYQSLNAYRSAIASMDRHIEGLSIGQHPLVSRLQRGAFHSRPPPHFPGTKRHGMSLRC